MYSSNSMVRSGIVKVSVIVPICNVEKFLRKCLSSLINQTLKDIEIICINDGSKDNSLEIINEFAEVDKRIVVIDKTNSGYGDTMNKGLTVAKGEYIGIVESDDFVDTKMFEDLFNLAKKYDADLVKSNYNKYWENPEKICFVNNLNIAKVETDINVCKERLFWGLPSIWSAIYKRSWILQNGFEFLSTPGASYQDTSFKFKTTALVKKVVLTPQAYLFYRQDNVNSSVKATSKDKVLLLHKEYDEIKRFIENNRCCEYGRYYFTQMLFGYLWNYERCEDTFKSEYFNIMTEAIRRENSKYNVVYDRLPKYLKFGGYNAIINNNKVVFDFMRFLSKVKIKLLN